MSVTDAVFSADNPVVALSLILVIGGAPFILVIIASSAGGANGCGLDEAGAYPCIILGRDFGRLLATMSVLGWADPVTIPIAIGPLLLWGVATILPLTWKRRTIKREREQ